MKKENGGAVGSLGAVANTYPGGNDVFDESLYRYIFEYRWNIGDAVLAAIEDATYDPNLNAYTWFGDPLMGVRSLPISAAPAVATSAEPKPLEDALWPSYLNPFNPETWIPYSLKQAAEVTIEIYALDGRLVRRISLGRKPAGHYVTKSRAAYWDGRNSHGERVAGGVYFYALKADSRSIAVRRFVVVK